MKNIKHITVVVINPKDLNIYRKFAFRFLFDSFGVVRMYERLLFYKYAIPSGLTFATRVQNRYKLIISRPFAAFALVARPYLSPKVIRNAPVMIFYFSFPKEMCIFVRNY